MIITKSIAELQSFSTDPSVLTVGNFDGVHCGHRMIIQRCIESAKRRNAKAYAVTFDPHPAHVLARPTRLKLITPLAEKLQLLQSTGLDGIAVLPFEEIRNFSASEFAGKILTGALHAVEIHEGETFRFGKNAEGDTKNLAQLGETMGFSVVAYEPMVLRSAPVSSSRIRNLISSGQLAQSRALLGRSFSVRSTPAPGRGLGHLHTVPTINLAPYTDLLPADGVYVTELKLNFDGVFRSFRGVSNAGNRPTFGADSYAVETYLFDFEPLPLTEETPIELTFLYRLRGEQRFNSPDALKQQIGRDVERAKRYFALCDALGATST
ncbi:MAG: riboflavin biosynthesis protein RibF [Bryocella sp.]